ncbi:V-type proton ATPase subunit C 1-A [Clonorchis sinensis]|uniref:V-type proton ATPase subunit C 1-A n=1 Tax=Clonorchis sinensis TaxID=79923 RepID=A0A3R7C4L8_CLOSI|nr:V-type proton ATPase subunit C 1-A [Clonorchis sinensis]
MSQISKRDPSLAFSCIDLICHTTIRTNTTSKIRKTLHHFRHLSEYDLTRCGCTVYTKGRNEFGQFIQKHMHLLLCEHENDIVCVFQIDNVFVRGYLNTGALETSRLWEYEELITFMNFRDIPWWASVPRRTDQSTESNAPLKSRNTRIVGRLYVWLSELHFVGTYADMTINTLLHRHVLILTEPDNRTSERRLFTGTQSSKALSALGLRVTFMSHSLFEMAQLGQPDSIPALVLPLGGMAARRRKTVTAERLLLLVPGSPNTRRMKCGTFERILCGLMCTNEVASCVRFGDTTSTEMKSKVSARNACCLVRPVAPFRCPTSVPPEGGTRAEMLSDCLSLDRRSRGAGVGFEPWTFWLQTTSEERGEVAQCLECGFTDRKVRNSNPTSASRPPLSRLGQPDSIPALVFPSGGMAVRHRKGATAERFLNHRAFLKQHQMLSLEPQGFRHKRSLLTSLLLLGAYTRDIGADSANLLTKRSVVGTRPLPLDFPCLGLDNLTVSDVMWSVLWDVAHLSTYRCRTRTKDHFEQKIHYLMSEFWIISLPGERNPDEVFERLNASLSKYPGLSSQWKFSIPTDLKVGTLDVLVGLSDELAKLDIYAESITKKVAQYMGDVLEEQRHKLEDNLTINGLNPATFLVKFQWDYAKYPVKQTLSSLYAIISEQLSKIDADLKVKSTAYNAVKGNLQNLERKQTGSLLTRDLGDIVKSEQFVVGSEYLATLVVVVPRSSYKEWQSNYATLTDMVVPNSSELLFEDQDNGLWTVTLFRKMIEDFKNRCRERRFIVRDFEYDEKKIEEGKTELSKLESDKKRQFAPLFRWLKINFGEAFSAMVHTKALRVFVESVLRYGLPVDFQAVLIQPNKKAHKRLRELLRQLYSHLDSTASSNVVDEEVALVGVSPVDYYPYVSFKVELSILDSR